MDGFRLLNEWQRGFPLVPRPFAEIAAQCNSNEERVIATYRKLKDQGVIDRIGPVFRPNTVGASTLAAMAVPPERLAAVAAGVNRHPGVNHNYEREHRYNLWFVVTAASGAGVRDTLAAIEREAGLPVLDLPLQQQFHIDLGFDLNDQSAPRSAAREIDTQAISEEEKRFLGKVASGLPIVARPYAGLGMDEHDAIAILGHWLRSGVVRRIGAVVRHRALGYAANAMVVWDVPDAEAEEIGRRAAADPAVTLCYQRARALPEWRYNFYCMLHGRARARVLRELARLRRATGLERFPQAVLFSRECFRQRAAAYG